MKGTLSKVLIVVGIILIVAAILWWAIAVNMLVKFPDNVEVMAVYQGDADIYMGIPTGQPVIGAPLTVNREYKSVSSEYDSSRAVVLETITQTIILPAPLPKQVIKDVSQYVLDRKSIENIDDPRSWAFEEKFQVNRAGSFYLSFPFDLSKDQEYQVWENKIGDSYAISNVSENGEQDMEGLKVYVFESNLEPTELTADCIAYNGYPVSMSFEDLKAQMAAGGVDIGGYLALLTPVLSPEDAAMLNQMLTQPIALTYKFYNSGKVALEPKTGAIISLFDVIEGVTVEPDTKALLNLQPVISKYKDASPELAAATEKLMAALPVMMQAPPQKVYEARYTQTEESIRESAQDAKDSIGMINWVKVYVPWILLILGAAVLVGGLLMGGSPAALEEEAEEGSEPPEE